jgi:hypothetical protein
MPAPARVAQGAFRRNRQYVIISAILVCLVLTGAIAWKNSQENERRIASEIVRLGANDDAYRKLLALGIQVRLAPWMDSNAQRVPDGYMLVVDEADDAEYRSVARQGVVFVKDRNLRKRYDDVTRQLEQIQKRLPRDEI